MSQSVHEFLRTSSFSASEDEDADPLNTISSRFKSGFDPKNGDNQLLLRKQENILSSEYRYRDDSRAYPGGRPRFVNVDHCIFMVGLPARGKTYIASKLCRYLNWCGISAKVFSVGEYRRKAAGTDLKHEFFDPSNIDAEKIRKVAYDEALQDGKEWLMEKDHHKVMIVDATNGTREKRQSVMDFCKENNFKPFFIESLVDDNEIINNFITSLKSYSPDYSIMDNEAYIKDFRLRMKHYESQYEEISDKCEYERCYSYIKIINAGKQYLMNQIHGYLQSQVIYYLMNIHAQERSLYITVHGECDYNVEKEVGGSSGLTETGKKFAKALEAYVEKENIQNLKLWTSSHKGPLETAKYISGPSEVWRALDYLNVGDCHGMKFADLAQQYPDVFFDHKGPLDFHWRYPGGESYEDMLSRLEPVIMELERQRNVLLISHRTTVRCLMAYFLDHNPDEVAHIHVPLHTVFKLTPVAYGCSVEKASLQEDGTLA